MIQKTFGREATAEELSSLGLWCWEAAFVQGFELAYGKAKERLMAAVGDL